MRWCHCTYFCARVRALALSGTGPYMVFEYIVQNGIVQKCPFTQSFDSVRTQIAGDSDVEFQVDGRDQRMLRKLPASDYSHKPPLEITEKPLEDPRRTELFRLATELGFQLTSHETLARELFLSMSKRLKCPAKALF